MPTVEFYTVHISSQPRYDIKPTKDKFFVLATSKHEAFDKAIDCIDTERYKIDSIELGLN